MSVYHMAGPRQSANVNAAPTQRGVRERPFWQLAGASWRRLAGGFSEVGFSFEWHELEATEPFNWSASFHPHSVEICLNLLGCGWVAAEAEPMRLVPETVGFFVANGAELEAERAGGEHQFLSVEFHIPFLRNRLTAYGRDLHPLVRRCLADGQHVSGVSSVSPLTHRHRDLLRSLLRPPVLASAQRLWYEAKALEFATEFFFNAADGETLCSRAQRLAAERVARAKAVLLESLAEAPSLEELGRRIGCSHFYLSRTFTRETGVTISQWLRRARLERAADLLRARKCNVTEAALEVGYSSLSHFSQAFHEMFGCCPGLYPLRTPCQQLAEDQGPTR
jgi:AraC-like DNA-binding protein